jgi:hypothetical protein
MTVHKFVLFGLLAAGAQGASAVTLITDSEAQLPKAPKAESRAGLTRGPSIEVVTPQAEEQVRSPARIAVRFVPHGGGQIAPDSVKLVYMSNPRVDLTERVKNYIKGDSLTIPDAEMPAGTHQLMLQVKDNEGRSGKEYLTLKVVK